ncbi:MAG: NADH-quinone oxidoreductase subunit C [Bryobacteraceae bacterium]
MADQPRPEGKTPTAPAAPAAPKAPPLAASSPWESDLTRTLQERFGGQIIESATQLGQDFLVVVPGSVIPILEFLKTESGFDYLVDITAVDYPKRAERFDLVYVLYSFSRNHRIRVKTRIAEGFQPPTAVGVHLTANWLEREVFDMFGIEFEGHPCMRRILLPEEWEGHPLRKDYPIVKQDEAWVRQNLGIESAQ